MTANGTQPTAEDVKARFALVENYGDPQPLEDPVIVSEQAVIGSAMQSTANANEAAAFLLPEHFKHGSHALVFEAILKLTEGGQPVEPASVLSELAAAGKLQQVHGPSLGTGGVYLGALLERAGSISYHARRVLADWQRREVDQALLSCRGIAVRTDFDPDIHLDEIRKRIDDVTAYAGPSALRPNSDAVGEVLDSMETDEEPGIKTGFSDLDELIGGMHAGELIVIGARPGVGKSLVALCIADYVGSALRLPVLFASLEMTEHELTQRRISAAAAVPLHSITRHRLMDRDWDAIRHVHPSLMNTRLHIDDTPHASVAHIRSRLRAMERTGNAAQLLVVDYLGFMAAPKADSRQQAVAELARQVKNIARDFAIPVILLAQLNRGPEGRHDKRPALADLRESGEIEQTADIAILLHREDAYNRESPRAGEMDLLIEKNRQGPQCIITVAFQGHYGRVVDMSPHRYSDRPNWSPSNSAE